MIKSSQKSWIGSVAGCIMLLCPVAASANDIGGAIVGGIIGGIIGGAIVNGTHRHSEPGRVYHERQHERPITSATSERTFKIQQALAFFGIYQGAVDGRSGPGTRRAIIEFQRKLNVAQTGELTDEQYKALLAVYAERTSPDAGPTPAGGLPRANNPDALIEAINRSTPTAPATPAAEAPKGAAPSTPQTTLVSAPLPAALVPANPATTPTIPALVTHYASVCIGGTALKSAGDSDVIRRIKDHLCASAAANAADVAKRLSDPKFSDIAAVSDQCKTISASIRAEFATGDEPQVTVDKLRDKLKVLTAEQRVSAIEGYSLCAGFGLTSNTLDFTNTNAVALAALNEPRYLEFVASEAAIGIEEPANATKAANWFDVAANSPLSLVQLSAPDTERQAKVDYFKATAADLRLASNPATQRQYLAGLVPKFDVNPKPAVVDTPQLGAGPGGINTDATPTKSMTHADLVDFIRPSIVFVYAPTKQGAMLGTGYFISPDLIVTNTHVVQDTDRDVIIANKMLGARVAHIVAKGMTRDYKGIDAAVLQMNGTPSTNFLKISRRIREGQAIAIGGFPGRAQDGHDKAYGDFLAILSGQRVPTIDTIPSPKFDFGFTQALVTNPNDNMHNLQIGVNTTHGNSGSPIVDSCGSAVGLDYEGSVASLQVVKTADGSGFEARGDSSQFSYALRMDEVVKFLDTLRVPYSETTAACAE